jgi:hypothetical protein
MENIPRPLKSSLMVLKTFKINDIHVDADDPAPGGQANFLPPVHLHHTEYGGFGSLRADSCSLIIDFAGPARPGDHPS